MKTLFAIAAAFASFAAAQGTLFVGTWPHTIQIVDEAQQKVVDHIELQTGTSHSMQISDDHKTIYASTLEKNGIEVIDVATRKMTNSFSLDEGGKKMRFTSWAPDPDGQVHLHVVRPIEKKIDRFDIAATRTSAWSTWRRRKSSTLWTSPEARMSAGRGRGGSMRFSPDGKYLYLFRNSISIFDASDFKLVDKIELSKPQFPGMENVGLGRRSMPCSGPGS